MLTVDLFFTRSISRLLSVFSNITFLFQPVYTAALLDLSKRGGESSVNHEITIAKPTQPVSTAANPNPGNHVAVVVIRLPPHAQQKQELHGIWWIKPEQFEYWRQEDRFGQMCPTPAHADQAYEGRIMADRIQDMSSPKNGRMQGFMAWGLFSKVTDQALADGTGTLVTQVVRCGNGVAGIGQVTITGLPVQGSP